MIKILAESCFLISSFIYAFCLLAPIVIQNSADSALVSAILCLSSHSVLFTLGILYLYFQPSRSFLLYLFAGSQVLLLGTDAIPLLYALRPENPRALELMFHMGIFFGSVILIVAFTSMQVSESQSHDRKPWIKAVLLGGLFLWCFGPYLFLYSRGSRPAAVTSICFSWLGYIFFASIYIYISRYIPSRRVIEGKLSARYGSLA
jgi:hypothetical protein